MAVYETPEKDDPAPVQKPNYTREIPKPVGGKTSPVFRRLSAHQKHVQHMNHVNHVNHVKNKLPYQPKK